MEQSGTIETVGVGSPIIQLQIPNFKLGVFHLDKTPLIRGQEELDINPTLSSPNKNSLDSYIYFQQYKVVDFSPVINPEVKKGASVSYTYNLQYHKKNEGLNPSPTSYTDSKMLFHWGNLRKPYSADLVGLSKTKEIYMSKNTLRIPLPYFTKFKSVYKSYTSKKDFLLTDASKQLYVNVQVKITPFGKEPYYIQKLFRAEAIEYNTFSPFPSNYSSMFYGIGSGGGSLGF